MKPNPEALHGRRLGDCALERVFRKLCRLLPLVVGIAIGWCAFYVVFEGRPLRGVGATAMMVVIIVMAAVAGAKG